MDLETSVIGAGLVISDGETWRRHRKMLNQVFHFDILKQYIPIYNEVCNKLIVRTDVINEQNNVIIN